jgi:menaquinone-dependent protoporphyrinogen IX oxidase
VIGSGVYYGSWLKEATEWVHRNQAVLAERPVWLFSVGPLGVEVKDTSSFVHLVFLRYYDSFLYSNKLISSMR